MTHKAGSKYNEHKKRNYFFHLQHSFSLSKWIDGQVVATLKSPLLQLNLYRKGFKEQTENAKPKQAELLCLEVPLALAYNSFIFAERKTGWPERISTTTSKGSLPNSDGSFVPG